MSPRNRLAGLIVVVCLLTHGFASAQAPATQPTTRRTVVSIDGPAFHINGRPTYAGRSFEGKKIEGLLMNSRMVQGIFDDLNTETRLKWKYPDGEWDANRNTREFVAAMPDWRKHGLLSFTINLQGGSPEGYSKSQPWENSAFMPDGSLRNDYMQRLAVILDKADELGMTPIVGYFYFGQVGRLKDEAAVVRATENATDWLLSRGYTNVLIEIANECDSSKYPPILRPDRAHELIELVQKRSVGRMKSPAGRLLVSTSFGGKVIPSSNVVAAGDFLLLHGNGAGKPEQITEMVVKTRKVAGYRNQPVLFNEDDHFAFNQPKNNFLAAVEQYAGWGYFDYRMKGEGFVDGYQSVPVDWAIGSERKRGFFDLMKKVTGE